jgi:hypothetical protein
MKQEKDWSEFNKIERILMMYHQFYYGIAPTQDGFPANSKKTFERDCNVLRKIGVEINYSKSHKGYIELFDYGLLQDAGKVSAEIEKLHAETEFEKYRIVQDRLFESDFDRFIAIIKKEGTT